MSELPAVAPIHVAAYVEELQLSLSRPSIKQHLAALKMLIPATVTNGVLLVGMLSTTLADGTSQVLPLLNGLIITPDTDAPHLSIDAGQSDLVQPGSTLQLYAVDWHLGLDMSKNIWSVVSGPGSVDKNTGIYTAPAQQIVQYPVVLKVTNGSYSATTRFWIAGSRFMFF